MIRALCLMVITCVTLIGVSACNRSQKNDVTKQDDTAVVGVWVPKDERPVPGVLIRIGSDHRATLEGNGRRSDGAWTLVAVPRNPLYRSGKQLLIDEGHGVTLTFAVWPNALVLTETRALFVRE